MFCQVYNLSGPSTVKYLLQIADGDLIPVDRKKALEGAAEAGCFEEALPDLEATVSAYVSPSSTPLFVAEYQYVA